MKRLNYKGSFFADVAREQREKIKYVSLLLGFSGVNIKQPKKQRKRPWLFHSSGIIFRKRNAVNGLVEVCIKSTVRNTTRLGQYLLFLCLCSLIILNFEGSVKWLIWLALAFILVNFVGLYWKESLAAVFYSCRIVAFYLFTTAKER